MPNLYEKHPKSAPWIAGLIATGLMLLMAVIEDNTGLSRTLGSIFVGAVIGVYFYFTVTKAAKR